ncbi:periaxin isoform X2 [Bufo gargarizans]|uniref:periaxin isoform X2 n=1 Tax=Bufo gargarizans TaxID=30331 RepID=UPI001CF17D22|nr:periaxin isoform X2 [Bufo gargarizans]
MIWCSHSPEVERVERHVSSKAPEPPAVKEKFSPLKQRSPPASRPHLSPEEIKDADRAAQKEKLHAELKKVLLLKGQRNSAEQEEPKMEANVKITEEKLRASEMVEVIVETEAQAGMSGINISGGGKDGLFVSEILKDSPAAKNLSLLEGDQIISARVYFENIKYEDAMKILQYAEQYKVSYCLKRTVPSSDVTVSPSSGSVEVKGPKAKMPKMTVKSLTPVKKKKKKVPGEVKDSEASMEALKGSEISAASLDIPPVDVEFSFPKFSKILKMKGGADTTTETKSTEISTKVTTEQKRLRMKFPRLRVKDAAVAGGLSVDISGAKDVSGKAQDEVKGKEKSAAQVGIDIPKMKKPKVDVTVAKPDIEFATTKVGIAAPQVGTEIKEETVFKTPQVELDIPLTIKKSETETSESIKATGLSTLIKIPDVEIKMPVAGVEVEAPEALISKPSISKVGICTPQIQKEQDLTLRVDGRPKTEIKLPSVEIAPPKLDVDLSLPKVEGSVEVETPASTSQGLQIKLPKFCMSTKTAESILEVTPPQVKKDIKGKVSEDKVKIPSVKTPQFGISLSKEKIQGDSPESQKKSSLKFPSIDISAPKVNLDLNVQSEDPSVEPIQVPDVTLKMHKVSPPKVGMKVKDAYAGTISKLDVKSEKVEAESSIEIPDVTLKMPKIGLPKLGLKDEGLGAESEVSAGKIEKAELKLKGPKLPSFGGLLVKEKSEVDGSDSSTETEGKLKFPSIKMPSVDIFLPKVQDSDPSKLEGTLPTTKVDKKGLELDSTDLKFKMPKVSLPKLDVTTKLGKPDMSPPKVGIHISGADTKKKVDKEKEDKITFDLSLTSSKPDLDISVEKPKGAIKLPKVELDSIAFDGQTGDSKVAIPSIKMPVFEIDAPRLDVGLNLPKVKTEGTDAFVEDKDIKFQMPKLNLPKLSDVAKDMAVELDVPKVTGDICSPHLTTEMKTGVDTEDKGLKMSLPKVEIGLGKSTEVSEGELKEKAEVKLSKAKQVKPVVEDEEAKMKLPSVKLPFLEIATPKIPDVDIGADIPTVETDVSGKEDLAAVISGDGEAKWKAPKFSFRKLGISGSKAKKGEVDGQTTDAERDIELAVKSPKMKMPKFGIVFPKSKQDVAVEREIKASKEKVDTSSGQVDLSSDGKVKVPLGKLPTVDISAPKLEVDVALPKGDASPPPEINIDIPDVKLNLPKFSMLKFGKSKGGEEDADIEKTKVKGKMSSSKSAKAEDASAELDGKSTEAKGKGRELKMKMPTIRMPSFGISRKDTDVSEEKPVISSPEEKTKKVKTVTQDSKVSLETESGDGKTSFMKMPTFKMSSPKVKAPEVNLILKGSKENLQMPDVHVKVPEVELPSFGLKSDQKTEVSLSKTGEKSVGPKDSDFHLSDKMKMPSLEISTPPAAPSLQISVPCGKSDICTSKPKVEVDVSDADIKRYEGDLKIPKLSSIGASVSDVKFDIGLPKIRLEHEADVSMEKSSAKIQIPRVELPKFQELEAKVDISGDKAKAIHSEEKLKGPKLKLPHVDISLPKVKFDEEDIPFIEGETKVQGSSAKASASEETFSLPSVELSRMSTPKIRAPELELDISLSKDDLKLSDLSKSLKVESSGSEGEQHDLKLKMPKIKIPKFGDSMTGVEEGIVKADVKTSKTEDSSESGIMDFKIKMPKLQVGSLKGKEEDKELKSDHKMSMKSDVKVSDHEDSDNGRMFKIKMPSFGISKGTTEAGTELLHPSEESVDLKFKMPKMTLPDVGFSGGESERVGASLESDHTSTVTKVKSITSSNLEELELDVGLKLPKIKMPTIVIPGRKGDDDMEMTLDEESKGKKSLFKMPDVELSTPKIKAHGEYEVDGTKLEQKLTKGSEVGDFAKKSSKIKDEYKHDSSEEDAENKYKVKLPKLAVSLPKAVSGDVELSPPKLKAETKDSEISMKSLHSEHESHQHEGKKTKKNIFSLSKTKDKSANMVSSDIDTSLELEGPELKIKLPKIKMKPSFGRSKGKGKGSEENGEEETDADSSDVSAKSSKIKFPRLGFSSSRVNSGESGEVNINGTSGHVNGENEVSTRNGSQDGVVKVGKLKFPKVEFSSPYKGKEIDSEMNLKLVKTEEPESKDEGTESSLSYKFKSPKIAFSGFKKKEKSEDHIISSSARTEMATMENVSEGDSKSGMGRISLGFLSSKSKGEYTVDNSGIHKDNEGGTSKDKSTKYKIPKLSLNSKSELSKEMKEESSQEGFKITLPQMSFTTHQEEETTEEQETSLGFIKVTTTKQIKTETVTEKTLAI